MPRFLVDEDLPRNLASLLQAAGLPAEDSGSAGLHGKKDPEVFAYAQRNGMVLVSGDQGFASLLQYPLGTHHGLVVTQFPNDVPAPRQCALILAALKSLPSDEIEGHLVLIEATRVRVRKMPAP
jgi:predicted nuclease of predicted toxin-antitoxin system